MRSNECVQDNNNNWPGLPFPAVTVCRLNAYDSSEIAKFTEFYSIQTWLMIPMYQIILQLGCVIKF